MQWNLKLIYDGWDDPAMERDFARLADTSAQAREALQSGGEPLDVLKGALSSLGEMTQLIGRLRNMAELTMAIDAGSAPATAAYDRLMKLCVNVEQYESALARYAGGVADLDGLIARDEMLTEHAYALRRLRERAAHTLDPAIEEAVLTMKLTGGRAWEKLRDVLESTYTLPYTIDGETTDITLVEARNLAYSPDPAERKAGYEAEIAGYAGLEQPMAACLSAIKGEALAMAKWMHYDSALDWSLNEAHMSRRTLDAMLTAMREALPTMRKYLRAKAKALGYQGGLPFYELFAPMGEPDGGYGPAESEALLLGVLGGFSPEMGEMIRRSFAENLIDLYPRAGKQGGAFCSGVYAIKKSFVLSNHDGTLSSVSTLAHELGHAFHDSQLFLNGPLNADAPMPLAETASIFNETMLTETLMKTAAPAKRVALLDQQLTDAVQTIVDIYSRFLFERAVFEERAKHPLGPSDFCRLMRAAQAESYAGGLDPALSHPYMWACKIHYYSPDLHFYNFPYAFGLLFGKGIYALYEQRGAAFEPEYRKLLRACALGDVEEVAASVGIDVTTPDFWRASLAIVGRNVDRFCEEVEKIERIPPQKQ